MNDIYVFPNPTGPTSAVAIDEDLCIGCNSCASICRIQTILPNAVKGKPPVVAYPDECWYCGCCVEACPTGALEMRLPINQRVMFKDKESGDIFRLGTKDAPPKTFFKAPYGWTDRQELGRVMQMLEREDVRVTAFISEETGRKIGRFFGEKEEQDESERLCRFMKLAGFSEVFIGLDDTKISADNDGRFIACVDLVCEKADISMNAKGLSDLLHRLCVSNTTAVQVWKSLKTE